jgi:circadian clock protein KaiC
MKGSSGAEARAATGIAPLDDILNGGLTRGHMYLIEGEPGAGKTTLALQFLLEGLRHGESVMYVTLSESTQELGYVASSHGWSLEGIEVTELSYLENRVNPEAQYTVFDSADVELGDTLRQLKERVERLKPKRIVVDSLSEVRLLARDQLRFRREILVLKQYFIQQEVTALLLDDRSKEAEDVQIESLAHGVVRLERVANEFGAERRRLMVMKFRGTPFRGGFHDYKIGTGGLLVFPRLVASEHRAPALPGNLLSGVGNLDDLLGGGLDAGTSTIVLGPAGAGKSTIATMYSIAAANQGKRTAMYLFDENIGTLLARCRALKMPLDTCLDSGGVMLRQVDPAEMSPGELFFNIKKEVEDRGVEMVILDSLVGLLNAMPEEKLLMSQLHELLSYLNQVGATTIMTLAQHGLVGSVSSQADLSYLCDTLILMRFFESAGEVRQAISVVKKRTGRHERTIREMKVAEGGITVGVPLREFQGVLTGVPTYVGTPSPLMEGAGNGSRV